MALSDLTADVPFGQGAGPGRVVSSKAARLESQARRVGEFTPEGRELKMEAARIRLARPSVVTPEYREFERLGQELADLGKSGELSPDTFADLKASHFNAVSRSGLKPRDKSLLFDFSAELDAVELDLDKAVGRKIKRKADKLGIKEKKQGLKRNEQLLKLGKLAILKGKIAIGDIQRVDTERKKADGTLLPQLREKLKGLGPLADVADEQRNDSIQERTQTIVDFLINNPEIYSSPKAIASIKSKLQDLGYNTARIEAREREERGRRDNLRAIALRAGVAPKDASPVERDIVNKVTGAESRAARAKSDALRREVAKEVYTANYNKVKLLLGQVDDTLKNISSFDTPGSAAGVVRSLRNSVISLTSGIQDSTKRSEIVADAERIPIIDGKYKEESEDDEDDFVSETALRDSLSALRARLSDAHSAMADEYTSSLTKKLPQSQEEDDADVDVGSDMSTRGKTTPAGFKVGDVVIWANEGGSTDWRVTNINSDGSFDLEAYWTKAQIESLQKRNPDWKPTTVTKAQPGPENVFTKHPLIK